MGRYGVLKLLIQCLCNWILCGIVAGLHDGAYSIMDRRHMVNTGPWINTGDHKCPQGMFKCGQDFSALTPTGKSQGCISEHWVCDGEKDCPDGSDEGPSCPATTCPPQRFQCHDHGICIPFGWLCDGEGDCQDESDESADVCSTYKKQSPLQNNTGSDGMEFKCPPNHFKCDGVRLCLQHTQLCDGIKNCPDGEDEGPHCRLMDCHDHCNSSQICQETREGPQCFCPLNQILNSTTGSCVDLDECKYNGYCDQMCENIPDGFTCSCAEGYQLAGDNRMCHALGSSFILLSAQDKNNSVIRKYSLDADSEEDQVIVNTESKIRTFDYIYDEDLVCYVDENLELIVCEDLGLDANRGQTEKTTTNTTFSLSSVKEMAYDWLSGNWYFTDQGKQRIFACRCDGLVCITMIHTDLETTEALALDPTRGLMFFTSLGESPKIESALLSGEERNIVVRSQQIVRPQSLTLDLVNQHVYWIDSYLDRLERVDYDGSNRLLILKQRAENMLRISLHDNYLYSIDQKRKDLIRFHRLLDHIEPEVLESAIEFPSDLHLVNSVHQPKDSNRENIPCNTLQCEHMCVSKYNNDTDTLSAVCLCQAGFVTSTDDATKCTVALQGEFLLYTNGRLGEVRGISLDPTKQDFQVIKPIDNLHKPVAVDVDVLNQYIYYSDALQMSIGRRKIDGSQRNDNFIHEGVHNPEGIAIDWISNNIYWTDERYKTISVASLHDPNMRKTLISTNISHPRAIVVDPRYGKLFWTDWVQRPSAAKAKIEWCNLDGSDRKVLVEKNLMWPNGLSYDNTLGILFWCDAYNDMIEYMDLKQTTPVRQTLTYGKPAGVKHPYGLVHKFDTDAKVLNVYWTEYTDGHIKRLQVPWNQFSLNHTAANFEVIILRNESVPLFELRLFNNASLQIGTNQCSNKDRCKYLCLIGANNEAKCVCPDGMQPKDDDPTDCKKVNSSSVSTKCSSDDEFQCKKTGRCINKQWTCDGDKDCGPNDNSDEDNTILTSQCYNFTCPDQKLMYRCSNNRCIYRRWMCDGEDDCRSGREEDEDRKICQENNCQSNTTRCPGTLRCIPNAWLCDHDNDCGNFYDEQNCSYNECRDDQFKCANLRCISMSYVCDGDNDCRDGSDEEMCPPSVLKPCSNTTHFWCEKEKKCIPIIYLCDGENNCADGADEQDCDDLNLCRGNQFQCTVGMCIPVQLRCDGDDDCGDNSDEADCPTNSTDSCSDHDGYQCPGENRCIPKQWVCDTENDCLDNSDESLENCGAQCELPNWECLDKSQCVPVHKVCDGTNDCVDNSDEGVGCSIDPCRNSECSHYCHATPRGYLCLCPKDMILGLDNRTCIRDEHPCEHWGVCAQKCTPFHGQGLCGCDPGYRLGHDSFSCIPSENVSTYIIFSNRHEIKRLGVDEQTYISQISGLRNTIALDYYYNREDPKGDGSSIFWTDVVDDKIYRGTMISSSVTNIEAVIDMGLATPEGLAVDWVTKHLYWVESNLDQIEVANFDGTQRTTLIAGNMESPRAIGLDPRKGKLFWSDWDQNYPRIEMCSMSGDRSTCKILFNVSSIDGAGWPNGLTVDYDQSRIYWIDARSDSIHTISYEGDIDQRQVLRGHEFLLHPFAISVFGNYVYWTDWRTNSLVRANKWDGSDLKVIQRTITQPFGLQVFHPKRQQAVINPCEIQNGGCGPKAICLLSFTETSSKTIAKCRCPHLYKPVNDTHCKLYDVFLLFARKSEIRGVDVENGDFNVMPALTLPNVHSPQALDYDVSRDRLYWTDGDNRLGHLGIVSAMLNGTDYRTVIDSNVPNSLGFAIDWVAENMYFTSYDDSTGWISVARMDGAFRTVIIENGTQISIKNPTSIALDPQAGRLYWTDANGNGSIGMANMDGSEPQILFPRAGVDIPLKNPSDITVEGGFLWWMSRDMPAIVRSDLDGSNPTLMANISTYLEKPTAMTVHGDYVFFANKGTKSTLISINKNGDADTKKDMYNKKDKISAIKMFQRTKPSVTNACAAPVNGNCNQLCLPSGLNKRVCRCTVGYTLDSNSTCVGVTSFLLYSNGTEILGIPLDPQDRKTEALAPISKIQFAVAIDFYVSDSSEDVIYWYDSRERALSKIGRDLAEQELIIPAGLMGVEGLAVDWIAGNIYWTNQGADVIELSRLDGSHRYVILHSDMDKPRAIAVHPQEGYLYWTDCGIDPKIERSRLDGSNRQIVLNTTIRNPYGLAIDYDTNMLYWCDQHASNSHIEKVDLNNGSFQRTTIVNYTSVGDCMGITVYEDYIYWTDVRYKSGSIMRANKVDGSDITVMRENLGNRIRDIKLFHKNRQPGTNACAKDNGGCDELCLYVGDGKKQCKCAHGEIANGTQCTEYSSFLAFSVVTGIETVHIYNQNTDGNQPGYNPNAPRQPISDKEKMKNVIGLAVDYKSSKYFYSDIQRGDIRSVHFNGTALEPVQKDVGSAEGLAYDSFFQDLYWTSYTNSSISRINISPFNHNPTPVKIFQLGPEDHPRAIVLDSCNSRMYWTNWNDQHASIQTGHMSGWGLKKIISTDINTPNGLTIDHKAQKLYWLDARLDKIERCDMDGTNRKVILSGMPQHGFGLTLYGDYLYWTDWILRSVIQANKYTGQEVLYLKKNIPRQPMGIVAVAKDATNCLANPCLYEKGGCQHNCSVTVSGTHVCSCNEGYVLNKADNRSCILRENSCNKTEFACKDGSCIDYQLTCDATTHCLDDSDEDKDYCNSRVCSAGYFHCSNKRCVAANKQCDGKNDCKDNSDEERCGCADGEFRCKSDGSCIMSRYRCDFDKDCPDASDEMGCNATDCSHFTNLPASELIKCNYTSACILQSWICDGHNDCWDGSDEAHCTTTTVPLCDSQWHSCPTLECIPQAWLCDGDPDCSDSSDEQNCTYSCPQDEFLCDHTVCIRNSWKCDRQADCLDGTDELDCTGNPCAAEEFTCESGTCISQSWVCDGEIDCPPMGEDEHPGAGCSPLPCDDDERRCENFMCVTASFWCDGDNDCGDNSDEPENCVKDNICDNSTMFLCKLITQCIEKEKKCDGKYDCLDQTDEINCHSTPCNETDFFCDNGVCINSSKVCNDRNDCGDWSDELLCNINECEMTPGICGESAECTDKIIGYGCECGPGFEPAARESEICVDMDECKSLYPCTHYCFNTPGSYRCSCADGFKLAANKRECKVDNSTIPPVLLVANRYYIRNISVMENHTELVSKRLNNAVAVDFLWNNGNSSIYWSDVTSNGSSISVMNLDGNERRQIHNTTIRNPDGIAVDWLGGNLYWCDKTTDTIEVSKLDGLYRKVLRKEDLQEPRAIVVHPFKGWLFYTDWGDQAHIGRMGMDGSLWRMLITDNLRWPNALTVDYITDHIFWADASLNYIAMSDLNGDKVKVILQGDLPHIFAMTLFGDYLYWTDWETKKIEKAHKFSGQNRSTVAQTIHRPMDVQVFHPLRQRSSLKKDGSNPCENNGGCGKGSLCLIKPGGSDRVCACPEKHYLSADKRSCIANCTSSEFLCNNTYKCIPFWWYCDGQNDCLDGYDEPSTCRKYYCRQPGLFQCDSADSDFQCISPTHICDGVKHCPDNSDEKNCESYTCLDTQFKCHSPARCIPSSQWCNGEKDCPDASDEKGCPEHTCAPNQFQCSNKRCVPYVWKCDNDNDCGDNSDEAGCYNSTCPPDYIKCNSSGRCVPKSWKCDGDYDCGANDFSDEPADECEVAKCKETYFKCTNNRCIPGRWRCDYDDDCRDGSDEQNCTLRACSESEFQCLNGHCIAAPLKCNGVNNCEDNSDEESCEKFECQLDEFQCNTSCIPMAWVCDNVIDCADGTDESNKKCRAEYDFACHYNEFKCDTGKCIPTTWQCDSFQDCPGSDNSDENPSHCEQYVCDYAYFSCGDNRTCIPMYQTCDGTKQCRDGKDEENCGRLYCTDSEYRCESGQCIPKAFVCDNYIDCVDSSDEGDFCEFHRRCTNTDTCTSSLEFCDLYNTTEGVCQCQTGFHRAYTESHNETCADINECEEHGRCSQRCYNEEGHYKCKCDNNYVQSTTDEKICEEKGFPTRAFLATHDFLRMEKGNPPHSHSLKLVYQPPDGEEMDIRIDSMDMFNGDHIQEGPILYITDVRASAIYKLDNKYLKQPSPSDRRRIKRSGSDERASVTKLMLDVDQPQSLAVDWVTRHLYWTDRKLGRIMMSQLGGTTIFTIVENDLNNVNHLAIDPESYHLYWSLDGHNPKIEMSLLDGSDRQVIANNIIWPTAMAFDHPNRRLYWTDAKKSTIESVLYDGSDHHVTYAFGQDELRPFKLGIVLDQILVSDYHTHTVFKMNKFGRKGAERKQMYETFSDIIDVLMVQENRQKDLTEHNRCHKGTNPCRHNARCINMPSPMNVSCVCPQGTILTKQNNCSHPPAHECPCKNDGQCRTNDQGIQKCSCSREYEGEFCEKKICYQYCVNGACSVLETRTSKRRPHCEVRLRRQNLTSKVDLCSESCPPEFVGDRCQFYICSDYCRNGGLCYLHNHQPTCRCPENFKGDRCELEKKNPCDGHICYNGGKCEPATEGKMDTRCQCPTNFTGARCESCRHQCDLDDHNCLVYSCSTSDDTTDIGAYCHFVTDSFLDGPHPVCVCPVGYQSQQQCPDSHKQGTCAHCVSLCEGYCYNGGICTLRGGKPTCKCPDPTNRMLRCENSCDNKCQNGGTCMTASSPNESFICRCGPGWEGKWCDIPMKYPCMVERCQNGGTCVADESGKREDCLCPIGFEDKLCNTFSSCKSTTCTSPQHGSCINIGKSLHCNCNRDYTGLRCERRMSPECINSCQNGGQCISCDDSGTVGTCQQCRCTSDWTGKNCLESITQPTTTVAKMVAIVLPIVACIICILVVVGIFIYRKRTSNQFKHQRMADNSNVEISNPIYMKDYEDEDGGDEFALDPDKPTNFANPMYETLYTESVVEAEKKGLLKAEKKRRKQKDVYDEDDDGGPGPSFA